MTTEDFMSVWADTELRQYLVNIAKAFTKDIESQEDLLQEAWLRISQEPYQKTCEYYMNQGFRAMDNCHHKEWREGRLRKWGKKHDSLRKRVVRAERKMSEKST